MTSGVFESHVNLQDRVKSEEEALFLKYKLCYFY